MIPPVAPTKPPSPDDLEAKSVAGAESPEVPVPGEVQEQRDLTSIQALAIMTPAEIKALSPEEKATLCESFITALKIATTIEARVRLYARIMDIYLVDAAIGAMLPVAGDLITSGINTGYMLRAAKTMGLSKQDIAKIVALQAADAVIGLIPLADLPTDTVFPANLLSARYFTAQLEKLIQNARVAGVPDEIIQKMVDDANLMAERFDFLYRFYKWIKGGKKGELPGGKKPQIPGPTKK